MNSEASRRCFHSPALLVISLVFECNAEARQQGQRPLV